MKMTLPFGSVALDEQRRLHHRRDGVGDVLRQLGEVLLHDMTKEGQQEVVRIPFSFHSCAS